MKKLYCIFTVVRNEKVFLPIFLNYYKKYFKNEDIFILDHLSSDGSTKNLDVNVEQLTHSFAYDHGWFCNVVKDYQKSLLQQYEAVVYVDVDEMLYVLHQPLNEYLDDFLQSSDQYRTCIAHEVVHDFAKEPNWDASSKVLQARDRWFNDEHYRKTLISKIPLNWYLGFHDIDTERNIDGKLFMLHLHRFDLNVAVERNRDRLMNIQDRNDGHGAQNKLTEYGEMKTYFKSVDNMISNIDADHKKFLIDCI